MAFDSSRLVGDALVESIWIHWIPRSILSDDNIISRLLTRRFNLRDYNHLCAPKTVYPTALCLQISGLYSVETSWILQFIEVNSLAEVLICYRRLQSSWLNQVESTRLVLNNNFLLQFEKVRKAVSIQVSSIFDLATNRPLVIGMCARKVHSKCISCTSGTGENCQGLQHAETIHHSSPV